MQDAQRLLWHGCILIHDTVLPGLREEDGVHVDIFLEEVSRRNQESFDWGLASNKVARFSRFPKWALNSQNSKNKNKKLSILDPYVKDSCIVKLMCPKGGVQTKFTRLVECLEKSGGQSFCGLLKIQDDLSPLCLIVSNNKLLGFCVEMPYLVPDDEKIDKPSLYAWWEQSLSENLRIGRELMRQDGVGLGTKVDEMQYESIGQSAEQTEVQENDTVPDSDNTLSRLKVKNVDITENLESNGDVNVGDSTSMKEILRESGSLSSDYIQTSLPTTNLTQISENPCIEDSTGADYHRQTDKSQSIKHLDNKLLLKTYVPIKKMSHDEVKTHLNRADKIVNTVFSYKSQLYTDNNQNQTEINLNNNSDCIKPKDTKESRPVKELVVKENTKISHQSISTNIINSSSLLQCKLCGKAFEKWQERHMHYLEVHCS